MANRFCGCSVWVLTPSRDFFFSSSLTDVGPCKNLTSMVRWIHWSFHWSFLHWKKWICFFILMMSSTVMVDIVLLRRTTSWSPKSQCVYGPENEIAAVTFFAKNGAALTKSNTFASITEWQDSGEHGCWLKVSSPAFILPIFAKAPCCLELFECCCRRLSQHGVRKVLIPLRHCWRDAFFCVCVGSESFCHDWASHCPVLFGSLDALFVFWAPPLRPPKLLTRQLCGSCCACRPEFNIIRLKNNSIYLKPDESFVYIGGRVSISWLQQIP